MLAQLLPAAAAAAAPAAPGTPASVGGSVVALLGTITLLLAALTAAWCIAAGIAGNARGSRRLVQSAIYGSYAFAALASLASALIIYAFVTHDFSIKYVAATSDTSMSLAYKVTAFWGGLDGSLLFWVLVLALFSTVAIWVNRRRHRDMIGYVIATIMVVQLFFLVLLIFGYSPFATHLTDPPADGRGLNPLLQNYWMVIHPPSLYIGFVAATIPFAFGIGALASGRLDDLWLSSVRSWMLVCFFFLSLGLILGGRWAYEELGWGGYWAWDPVENAGFLPWFTATAFLHSATIQEQRGMLKNWNLILVILTFFLTIFGTFMTRSGVVQSVHAFGKDDELALQFIVFMIVILVVSFGLLAYRSNRLGKTPQLESFASREFAFLINNWILLGCAFFVLFATMFPTISEAIDGGRASVGAGFFNRWMTPLGLVLLLLAGAAPLLAWRRTTRERLWSQFLWPTVLAVATMVVLAVALPQTRVTTEVFARGVELPMSLVTYGFCAFVWGSVVQEFVRGAIVRRRQTGSDPVTSLIGLVLTKRRKYGGYIVHAGVAILFLGFTGKAYERMDDRTIARPIDPAQVLRVGAGEQRPGYLRIGSEVEVQGGQRVRVDRLLHRDDPAWFTFHDYRFLYEDLIDTQDDSKSAMTARVSVWQDGEQIATLYPARWDFHRGEQPTTEVAIHSRFNEDVYIVLTGFGRDAAGRPTGMANFRVWKNPLILWVWLGYLTIAFGTLVCLLPAGLVNRASRKPATLFGRAADVGAVLLFFVGSAAAITAASRPGVPHELQDQPYTEAAPPGASTPTPDDVIAPTAHLAAVVDGPRRGDRAGRSTGRARHHVDPRRRRHGRRRHLVGPPAPAHVGHRPRPDEGAGVHVRRLPARVAVRLQVPVRRRRARAGQHDARAPAGRDPGAARHRGGAQARLRSGRGRVRRGVRRRARAGDAAVEPVLAAAHPGGARRPRPPVRGRPAVGGPRPAATGGGGGDAGARRRSRLCRPAR
ncbi:MAG: heme lyase CcmF/NrfE family subunit [Kofleriaceae bacterium]